MQDFKKSLVWQRGHALTLKLYDVTATFPATGFTASRAK